MSMKRSWYAGAGLLAAGALAGGILGGTFSANAATGSTPSSGPTASHEHGPDGDGHAGESTITGADAATLRAAALKAVPGGTIDRIESDSGDAAFEAHMTKSDGTQVTVKFDKSLKVTAVEAGMGK